MTLQTLADTFFAIFGMKREQQPPPAPRKSRVHYKGTCLSCGRIVAHTKNGEAYKHNCVPKGQA